MPRPTRCKGLKCNYPPCKNGGCIFKREWKNGRVVPCNQAKKSKQAVKDLGKQAKIATKAVNKYAKSVDSKITMYRRWDKENDAFNKKWENRDKQRQQRRAAHEAKIKRDLEADNRQIRRLQSQPLPVKNASTVTTPQKKTFWNRLFGG